MIYVDRAVECLGFEEWCLGFGVVFGPNTILQSLTQYIRWPGTTVLIGVRIKGIVAEVYLAAAMNCGSSCSSQLISPLYMNEISIWRCFSEMS